MLLILVGGIAVTLGSCANPVAPSGGPRDETPPSIVETRPVRDTVNVSTDTRSVTLRFSEYVERSTLPQALSITPQFDRRLRFDWSGRSVDIELPTALRDSTTYLFTLDTNLSDAHGVSLDDPITVAFSTGPRINRGQIRGRVVTPEQGQPQPQVDVYAYALSPAATAPPSPLPDRPAYRTQTGEDGTFTFEYLREQRYYVVALKDNNRNRRPDPPEPFAVPPRLALQADSSGGSPVPVPWLLTRADTLAPRLQRVQPVSRQRLRLSFSEPIRLADRRPAAWTLRDSVAGARVPVQAVYRSPDRGNTVVLRTGPMEARRHMLPLTPALVTDTLGQALVPDTARFRAVAQPDTAQTRFQSFVPDRGGPDSAGVYSLLPGQQPGVRFNQAPDSTTLRRVLSLADTTGRSRSYGLDTENGRTYRLRRNPPLRPGEFVEVAVDLRPIAGPDTTVRRRFRRVTSRALGELEGRVLLADTTGGEADKDRGRRLPAALRQQQEGDPFDVARPATGRVDSALAARRDSLFRAGPVVVELIPTETPRPLDPRSRTVPPGSTFVFRELPEGTFRFRAFLDRNRNGRWDGGLIRKYLPAEPVTWSTEPVDSRPRWTNVVPAPLRIPLLLPAPLPRSAPLPDTTSTDTTSR
jgi:uncharacterized protein (DUF2141 family)